ncbi:MULTISPECIES: DUF1153 domain-containing protein [Halomonadaceae]|uniref:Transposase n=1 Tax=Vreelandella halophila TaxID=86177 RepID=A0A9X4YEE7_9GAMM|nr:transposase [Halomonas utahensis]MYL76056.1 transposase [Halomonas sp. 22501_18_FS]
MRRRGGSDERSTEQRWTAKRKTAVVMDILKGKTTAAEVARQHDLTVSEVERWIDEAQRNMENGFKSLPRDIREQYESELRDTKEALGEAHVQIHALKRFKRLLDEDENS